MEQVVALSDAIRDDVSLEERLAYVVDTARETVAVDRLHLWALAPEGDRLLYVTGSGLSEEDERALGKRPELRLGNGDAMARAIRQKVALLVNGRAPRRAPLPAVGAQSFYVLPVIARQRTLGLLVADNARSGAPLVPDRLRLLSTFAMHVATAVDNTWLLTELHKRDGTLTEALEQQGATAEILKAIATSPTDGQPVFDAIARSATRLCGGIFGAVDRFDGQLIHRVAQYNFASDAQQVVKQLYPMRPNRRLAIARAVLDGRVVHVPDVEADPEYDHAVTRAVGMRSTVAVPLLRQGSPIGAIGVAKAEPTPFSDTQIAMLHTFADQALIAIENTRLFKELESRNRDLTEALEQQTATSEILQVISSSPTDLQPVLDAVVERAAHLCSATDAMVLQVEGESLKCVAACGPLMKLPAQEGLPIRRDLLTGRTVIDRAVIHVPDVVELSDREFAAAKQYGKRFNYRAALVAPMVREDRAVGVIAIYRAEPVAFTRKQIDLLQTFAQQAVIAIENTRLFKELESRNRDLSESLEQQTATSEILRVISSSPTDLAPVFRMILEKAARLAETDVGLLWMHEDDGSMRCVATCGTSADYAQWILANPQQFRKPFYRPKGPWGTGHFLDVREETAYREGDPFWTRTCDIEGVRTLLAVPLVAKGRLVGSFGVTRREVRGFSEQHIALLETFADQAVIAIENTRLFNELESRNRDLTEALEQQTATSELLKVISRSTFDLDPVLVTLVANATMLCHAEQGFIFRFDGELSRLVASHNTTPEFRAFVDSHPIPPGRGTLVGRVVLERSAVHIPDAVADPEYEWQESQTLGRFRTMLGIPMLRQGVPIGVIALWRGMVQPFSRKEIALVTTFADQAVIAIENTRLFNELQTRNRDLTESLEQQTATSEILRVISQSQRDVQPVFEAIAENARKLGEATFVVVSRFDGELIHIAAVDGYSPEGLEELHRAFPMPPSRGGASARALLTRAVVYIPDVGEDVDYRLQSVAQTAGFRSAVAVPMLRDGSPIGAISVAGAEPAMFSERHIAMLQTFADQAVIAVENTRLFNELQARTAELGRSVEELKALGEVSSAVSSTLDLDTVLTTILTHANQLAGTQAGQIFDYDEVTEELSPRATFGYTQDLAEALRRNPIRRGEGVTGQAVLKRQPVQVPDIAAEGAYDSRLRNLIMDSGFRALLAVPLIREDQVMGALAIARTQPGEFSPQVIDLLTTFASQSALAMQNARLFHQLEIASQHKSSFLANMSHELRTPLNAIIGYSEMLQEDAVDEGAEGLVPDLKRVNAAGKHLLELINSILDLSKIEAGKMELQLEEFSVTRMVEDIGAVVKPLAEKNGNRLELVCDAGAGTMHADLTKVRQVLFNLLSNACKFTERGTVALAVHREESDGDAWLSFSVSDSGIGLSADQLGRLFQEFSQAHADAKRKYGGTGLGLALSRRLCRLMGGDIAVTSEPGKGSTFTVRLPVDVAQIHEMTGHAAGSAGTVLVIDDEAVVRELMQRFLGKEGFRVLTAASGEDGLRLAREQRPDAITLDVMMPGMDGWAVLCALTTDPQLADIPVIMLTIVDNKKMGYALGASEYLTKPIDRARLVAVLTKYRRDLPVLVVDDDASIRQLLRRILEEEGYTVVEADNGRVALERLGERVPGAILLDLMMPEMDGFEFLSTLHGREAWRHIPVVIVTAKDLTREEHDRLNGSVVRILQKGAYAQEELLAEVRALVAASIGRRKGRGG